MSQVTPINDAFSDSTIHHDKDNSINSAMINHDNVKSETIDSKLRQDQQPLTNTNTLDAENVDVQNMV